MDVIVLGQEDKKNFKGKKERSLKKLLICIILILYLVDSESDLEDLEDESSVEENSSDMDKSSDEENSSDMEESSDEDESSSDDGK